MHFNCQRLPVFVTPCPFFFFLCARSVDKERGERDVHGDQTLCVREPHPPGELRERTGRGGLESWTGEGHPSHFLQ